MFGAVLAAAGTWIIKTPARAPRADAIAKRWISGARGECPGRVLITGQRHLRLVLGEYAAHCSLHRPHRAMQQARLPGARFRLLLAPASGFCAGTGSAA